MTGGPRQPTEHVDASGSPRGRDLGSVDAAHYVVRSLETNVGHQPERAMRYRRYTRCILIELGRRSQRRRRVALKRKAHAPEYHAGGRRHGEERIFSLIGA